ncbi:hypothetical protein HC256_010709 [Beauveria bassiana]|nr:hypothetical protein HC256_010709 [Beauveria bassiana]
MEFKDYTAVVDVHQIDLVSIVLSVGHGAKLSEDAPFISATGKKSQSGPSKDSLLQQHHQAANGLSRDEKTGDALHLQTEPLYNRNWGTRQPKRKYEYRAHRQL